MLLTEREWTVLSALWELKGAELHEVVRLLYSKTGWSRNTVHTYLTRMEQKGLVRIEREVNPHLYYATLDKEDCRRRERKSFLKRVYSGSAGDLITAFLKEEQISEQEKENLRKLLDEV